MPKKKSDTTYYEGIGRRRTAVARVRLYVVEGKTEATIDKMKVKKGEVYVNSKAVDVYFPHAYQKVAYEMPFTLTDSLGRFAVVVKVNGGGTESQLEAFSLGASRALLKVDESMRPALKKDGLLTRDSRVRERRKVGTGGRARRKKQSPKR